EPESLDKEVVRRAYIDGGYSGDGEPPPVPGGGWAAPPRRSLDASQRPPGAPPAAPGDGWTATSTRYIDAYQRLTGLPFEPGATPVDARIAACVAALREGPLGNAARGNGGGGG